MHRFFFILLLVVGSIGTVGAQKYGHLNFGNLVAQMSETKAADATLETYQKDLLAKGEEMVKSFEGAYRAFVTEVQSGGLAPKDQQSKELNLQQKQQEIQAFERKVVQDVQVKRDELLKPIIEKAQKAVETVAKENGYLLIFDTSVFNAVLFAQDSDNVMDLVKAKLGL